MTHRRGFTLIELLVVIAIIAILAAILFPVYNATREKGRTSACAQNIRQLALAIVQYADDYDDELPVGMWTDLTTGQTHYWYEGLMPYIQNYDIWTCPSEPDVWLGYGYNYQYLGFQDPMTGQLNTFKAGMVRNKARTISLADTKPFTSTTGGTVVGGREPRPLLVPVTDSQFEYVISKRHNQGANCAHLDGHVKWFSYDTLLEHPEWWDRNLP